MVATFPDPENQPAALFKYLKRCQPQAPNIASGWDVSKRDDACPSADPNIVSGSAPLAASDLFDSPLPLSKKKKRWLSLLFGCAQVAAVGLSLWAAQLPNIKPVAVEPHQPTTAQQRAQNELWHTLASDSLAKTLRSAKEKQVNEQLAAAEQERLQAQQLRIHAEAQAQTLTEKAASQAQQTTVAAVRRADLIALDATFIDAEQIIYAGAGDDITLKFAARIQCKEGRFGETAVASPVDARIAPREVRNLAVCYPKIETPAGAPIGQAGEWGVAFFKME